MFNPITEITPDGLKTKDGEVHKCDVLVCATGFKVGFCPYFEVKGKDGRVLQEEWDPDPKSVVLLSPT